MGDIWPYGPPKYITYVDAVAAMETQGMSHGDANVMAAIGEAESTLDLSVINDTPSTGDYSVGIWQINYYGDLYAERAREFGTPGQLVRHGLTAQAYAAYTVWRQQGFNAWSTYKSGAYKQYLTGSGGPNIGGRVNYQPVPPPDKFGSDDWRRQIVGSAGHFTGLAHAADSAAKVLRQISR